MKNTQKIFWTENQVVGFVPKTSKVVRLFPVLQESLRFFGGSEIGTA